MSRIEITGYKYQCNICEDEFEEDCGGILGLKWGIGNLPEFGEYNISDVHICVNCAAGIVIASANSGLVLDRVYQENKSIKLKEEGEAGIE